MMSDEGARRTPHAKLAPTVILSREDGEGSQNTTDRSLRSFAVFAAQDDGGCARRGWCAFIIHHSSFARTLARREVALQPLREAVEAGEEDALGDVGLIEFVAHFPLQRGRDDDPLIGGLLLL